MNRPHVHEVDGTVRLELDPFEYELLQSLPGELRSLLEDPDPADPAVERLFPTAVVDDERTDAEVRELIHDDLLRERLDGLDAMADILQRGERRRGRIRVDLVDDEPALVLGVLNDVRLTLACRVGLDRLERDEIGPEHPAAPTIAVVNHLAWIQEQLLHVIDPPSVDG